MMDEYGIEEEWASFVIGAIARSLGISLIINDSITALRNRAEMGDENDEERIIQHFRRMHS